MRTKQNRIEISIGSDTLNDIIGKDTDLQVKLRRGIVENFTKSKLKSMVDEYTEARLKIIALDAANIAVANVTDVKTSTWFRKNLNESTKKSLDEYINNLIIDKFDAIFESHTKSLEQNVIDKLNSIDFNELVVKTTTDVITKLLTKNTEEV